MLNRLTTTPKAGDPAGISQYLPYLYVGVICVISVAAAYFTHMKPARDLEKPLLRFLAVLAENPLKLGRKHGIAPRMNVMLVHRPWYLLGSKRMRVVWSANMDSFPDVRFSCSCNQGVSGQALRKRLPVLADCSVAE